MSQKDYRHELDIKDVANHYQRAFERIGKHYTTKYMTEETIGVYGKTSYGLQGVEIQVQLVKSKTDNSTAARVIAKSGHPVASDSGIKRLNDAFEIYKNGNEFEIEQLESKSSFLAKRGITRKKLVLTIAALVFIIWLVADFREGTIFGNYETERGTNIRLMPDSTFAYYFNYMGSNVERKGRFKFDKEKGKLYLHYIDNYSDGVSDHVQWDVSRDVGKFVLNGEFRQESEF